MVNSNFKRSLVFIFILINFTSFSFAAFPDFSFTTSSFPSGPVDIVGQASSGTQVELYANGNFVGRQDILSSPSLVLLNNSITNTNIGIGSSIVFRNNDLLNTMSINFSGTLVTLGVGGSYTFNAGYVETDYLYTHINTGQTAVISVENDIVDFTFSNVEQTYLIDGTNTIGFTQNYPLSTLNTSTSFNFSVLYDKYPNNILVQSATNLTRQREGTYSGIVSQNTNPLYYVLNYEGPIVNTGILQSVPINGSSFDITIDDLREGNNSIRFISTDPSNVNVFTGEVIVNTLVDTINPFIEITDSYFIDREGFAITANFNGQTQYFNGLNLLINLTTDAHTFEVVLNNVSIVEQTDDSGRVFLDLGLQNGQNSLVLIATDLVGNIYKEAHVIEASVIGPQLIIEEMEPEELFLDNGVAHFYFQQVSGQTTEPNVDVTVFSFVRGSAGFQDAPPGYEEPQSCLDFKSSFVRNLGQLDRERPRGPELNLDETQTSVALQSFIFNKQETTSDSEGNFNVILGLQERDFDRGDYFDASQEERTRSDVIESVESENIICFVLTDKFGNVKIIDFQVTLDAGNTQWRPGEITTIPNTVYAAEIEDAGDVRAGTGNIRFGMIAKFQYIGPGSVKTLTSVRINEDRTQSRFDEEYARTRIVQNEMNYRLDTTTGEMIVYVPVEVLPLRIPPHEYPDNFDLAFAATLVYTVDDVDIPIDTQNPIYFRTKLNVERPLDHTKWLTPKMLDDTLNFLNKSIYYTQKAVDYTGFAAVGGVLACTGAKFIHAAKITAAAGDATLIEEADRFLYQICDRVACTASPRDCSLNGADEGGYVKAPEGTGYSSSTFSANNFSDQLYFEQDGLRTGELDNVRFTGACDYNGDGIKGDGVLLVADASLYKDSIPITGGRTVIEEESKVRGECVPAKGIFTKNGVEKKLTYDEYSKLSAQERAGYQGEIAQVNLNSAGNICFNENAPNYDNHRCNFFNSNDPFKGKDSATSIISSVQCACVTDTYSHLKVALRVQEGIAKCLQQAKIGYVKGSYCERLLSQAVCDIATNVVLPELQQSVNARQGAGDAPDTRGGGLDFLANMKKSESAFNQRYSGSILSQTGLSTDQIINKACVGAITGDWSVLTDNILTAIDENEVEPVFGPPFPESRQMGYNPITGEMSIQYRFTHGIVSGGQIIRTRAELVCDSSAPYGQYCPESQIVVSSDLSGSGFKSKNLPPVQEGGSIQDTVIITDAPSKFWYNKLRLTYEYTLKGKKETEEREFTILHKQETLLANCYWSPGIFGTGLATESDVGGTQISTAGGISCDSLFGDEALISIFEIDKSKTKLVPQQTFYPDNKVYVDLGFNIKNNDKFNQDLVLAYIPVCTSGASDNKPYYLPQTKDEVGKALPYTKPLSSGGIDVPTLSGTKLLDLAYIPDVSLEGQESYVAIIESTNFPKTPSSEIYLKISSKNGINSPVVSPTRIVIKGAEGSTDSDLSPQLTPQNLNVNQGPNAQNSYVIFKINYNLSQEGLLEKIVKGRKEIYFRESIEEVFIEIVEKEGEGYTSLGSGISGSAIDPVKTGSCEVIMRIMPSSEALQLTVENFETYNTGDGVTSEGNIITNVKVDEVVKLPFSVRKKPTNIKENQGFFALAYPKEGNSVQVNPTGNQINIPMSYIYQTIQGESKDLNPKLRITLSVERYGNLEEAESTNKFKEISLSEKVEKTIAFKFDGELKNQVNSADQSTLSSWISGGAGAIQMNLEYEVIENKASTVKEDDTVSSGKKSIKLYLVPSDVYNGEVDSNPAAGTVTIPTG